MHKRIEFFSYMGLALIAGLIVGVHLYTGSGEHAFAVLMGRDFQ